MKERGNFPTVFWILAGVLLLGWALLLAGSRETRALPSASSFAPSGTAAFAELLRQEGYQVRIDTSNPPHLKPEDVAICAFIPRFTPETESLSRHLESGGRIVAFALENDFDKASRAATGTRMRLESEGRPSITVTGFDDVSESLPVLFIGDSSDYVPLWNDPHSDPDANEEVFLTRCLRGVVAVLTNGLVATNRFVDAEENARLLVDTVGAVAPEGGSIVFLESTIGNARGRTLLGLIGPWAAAAGWQVGLLLFVIAYTLGRRFGLPETERGTQRGARDLVDAIGNVYGRARATPIAMATLVEQANHLISRELKLPRDATKEERDRRIPEALALALLRAEAETVERISHSQALTIARALDAEIEAAFGPRVPRSTR